MFKKVLLIVVFVGCICSLIYAKEAAYIGTYQVGEVTYEEFIKQIVAQDSLMPGFSYQQTVDLMKSVLTYPLFLDQINSAKMKIIITEDLISVPDSEGALSYSIDSQRNLIVYSPEGESLKIGMFTEDYLFLDLMDSGSEVAAFIRLEKQQVKSE